jgi:hypothetical protein
MHRCLSPGFPCHLRPVFLNRSTVEVMMTRRSSAVLDDESGLYQNHTVPLDQGY